MLYINTVQRFCHELHPTVHFIRTDSAQVLNGGDIWRGHPRQFTPQAALATGYPALNAGLLS